MRMKNIWIAVLAVLGAGMTGAAADNHIVGSWQGRLKVTPQVELKLVFHLETDAAGRASVTLDSPDQGVYGIVGEVDCLSADSIRVSVRRIGLSYAGHREGDEWVGRCTQGAMDEELILYAGKAEAGRPQTPRPPFPYGTEEVTFNNLRDQVVLAGTLTLPEGCTAETPAVVMVTGSGLQNRDEEIFGHKPFAVIADYLARNGIASLRYDDRGFGESTGDGTNATTEDFAQDAKAGVEYMRRIGNFKHVGVLGHSEGATVAFMLGAKNDPVLCAGPDFIIALGAQAVRGDSILIDQSTTALEQGNMPERVVSDYAEALRKVYALKMEKGDGEAFDRVEAICAGWETTPVHAALKENLKKIAGEPNPWIGYFIGFSPAGSIAATDCPAFVLYGEKDIQIRPDLNMPPMRRLAPDATIKLYPGLNHLFQQAQTGAVLEYGTIEETISPEVLRDIQNFITSLYDVRLRSGS